MSRKIAYLLVFVIILMATQALARDIAVEYESYNDIYGIAVGRSLGQSFKAEGEGFKVIEVYLSKIETLDEDARVIFQIYKLDTKKEGGKVVEASFDGDAVATQGLTAEEFQTRWEGMVSRDSATRENDLPEGAWFRVPLEGTWDAGEYYALFVWIAGPEGIIFVGGSSYEEAGETQELGPFLCVRGELPGPIEVYNDRAMMLRIYN